MKIKNKNLANFVKKFRMTGGQQITEAVFKFEKEGLKVTANSASKQSRVMGWLKTTAFKEYEAIGNVGMNDLENIARVLDRFGDEISLKKEGNLLTISGDGKKVDIELVSENFLDTDTGEPALEFEDTFTIPASKIKDIFKDVTMNKDAILHIETLPKKVIFSNTGKYKFRTEVPMDTCKGGVKVDFGEPMIDALINLDGMLDISTKSNYPLRVIEKTEESIINIIVAPRIEEN